VTIFGSPAAPQGARGFASPPHEGFAIIGW